MQAKNMNKNHVFSRFTLHYYSASRQEIHQKKDTLIQIDTREVDNGTSENISLSNNDSFDQEDTGKLLDPLKMAIQTRYHNKQFFRLSIFILGGMGP